jgi:hypothetical protein
MTVDSTNREAITWLHISPAFRPKPESLKVYGMHLARYSRQTLCALRASSRQCMRVVEL